MTGGIGAGKSEAGKAFAELGALVIDADALAREAVAPRSEALERIAALYPDTIASDGTLDRAALATIVFSDVAAREALGALVHPYVRERAAALERAASPDQVVIHEVPLLFESGFYRWCDANVVVVADEATRIGRVVARTGWNDADVRSRIRAQIDPDRACELADYTIVNDASLEALHAAVSEVYEDLLTRVATVSRSVSIGGEKT